MRYTKEILQDSVKNSTSFAGVIRLLGLRPAGGTQSHLKRRIDFFGVDTSHFKPQCWNKGTVGLVVLRTDDSILCRKSEGSRRTATRLLRRAMLSQGVPYQCETCRCGTIWNGKTLVLQVDHKDGDWLNDLLDNLRFLCPNCHSQTDTFGSKNISLVGASVGTGGGL